MIVLNNVAVGDTYTDATTVLSESIENLSLFVFNNAVTIQVFKKPGGGGQNFEPLPEQNMAPGSAQFPGAIGIRIKNAAAGAIARVILVAPEYDPQSPDPGMVGYVPTTLTLTASGAVGAVASPFYQKNNSLVDITSPGGSTETDILNCVIKASDINVNSRFEFDIECDFLDSGGAGSITWRAYIGATKIIDTGAINMENGGGIGGSRQPLNLWGQLFLRGALNSQWTTMNMINVGSGAPAPTTGIGTYGGSVQRTGIISSSSAVDMSVDQTFRVTAFWSVNDASHSFRKYGSLIQLF